jgi:hypothetical protein
MNPNYLYALGLTYERARRDNDAALFAQHTQFQQEASTYTSGLMGGFKAAADTFVGEAKADRSAAVEHTAAETQEASNQHTIDGARPASSIANPVYALLDNTTKVISLGGKWAQRRQSLVAASSVDIVQEILGTPSNFNTAWREIKSELKTNKYGCKAILFGKLTLLQLTHEPYNSLNAADIAGGGAAAEEPDEPDELMLPRPPPPPPRTPQPSQALVLSPAGKALGFMRDIFN